MGCCGGGASSGSAGSCGSDSSGSEGKAGSEGKTDGKKVEFEATDDMPVFFTDSAVEAVRKALTDEGEAGDFLRVSVVGGGCSGYQYGLDFDKEERIGDLALDFNGVKIVVDQVSAGYLKGTVIDYVSSLRETGFQFLNPNAKRTCGCGHSFS